MAAQGQRVGLGQGHAVDGEPAGFRVIEAQQQLEHGALARPGGAYQGYRFAGLHRQTEVVEGGGVGT